MRRYFYTAAWAVMGIVMSGCPVDGDPDSLSISPGEIALEVGKSAGLTANSSASSDSFMWSSDNAEIATVTAQGRVSGLSAGSTRVRVASGKTGLSASAKVTVVEDVPPAISLGEPSASDTRQGPITFDVTYAGVTAITLDPADITINATGTVAATVGEITSTGVNTRSIAIDPISGDGTFTIAIAAGTANDSDGNQAPASNESAVVNVDNTAPTLEISAPSAANASTGPIDYLVNYGGADDITLTKADVLVNGTGTVAATLADVAATGEAERTVSFSSIDGDGTLGISIAAATAADRAGNTAEAAGPSEEVTVDNTPPTVTIGAPSPAATNSGPLSFRITYDGASEITLSQADIILNGSSGVVSALDDIEVTSETVRTVRFSTVAGDGTLGISLAAGTATDAAGNSAPAAGPSATATIDNTGPTVTIGAPSVNDTSTGPITFPVTYEGASDITLSAADITFNRTGTANAQVTAITGAEGGPYHIILGSVIGNGTLGISLAANTASDAAGNIAAAAGPSATFQVENVGPSLLIGPPSSANTFEEPVSYTITYADATAISLAPADITLNSEDGVTATIAVTGDGLTQRTVTLSAFSGFGEVTISIAAGTAQNDAADQAPAAGPSAPFSVNPILQPGSGFTAPTPQPDPIGDPGAPGIDAKAIARWDVVPYQTFDGYFNVGVVAFHINDIDRVEFSVEGGPWTAVREMTLNPETDVVEYWVGLDARDFEDGPIEVRAVAYPKVGIPRVLEGPLQSEKSGKGETSLFLNTNAGGTLPEIEMYVSTSGDNATGDGTESNPYRTMMRAAKAIQDASTSGNADGGIIYLAPGEHWIGSYNFGLLTNTANRWLTIQPMPGASREETVIVGADSTEGLRTKLVCLRSVTLAPDSARSQTLLTSNGPMDDYFWVDDCRFVGPGRTVNGNWYADVSGVFLTDCEVSDSRDAPTGRLVRNMRISNIGSDALSGNGLSVNCDIAGIDSRGTEFHADVLQLFSSGVVENRIAYGVEAASSEGQGVFGGAHISIQDIALVNCNVNNRLGPNVQYVFQFGGPTNHMYVLNCIFTGSAVWRVDVGFSARNVVLENTTFSSYPQPLTLEGVTYRPPLAKVSRPGL